MTLQEWMELKDFTDAKLATALGGKISRSQISRIRTRKSIPSRETALALAQHTGIPAADFLLAERAA